MTEEPAAHAHLRETLLDRRILHEGRYLTFCVDTIRDGAGQVHVREVAEHPGAIAVVALDGDDILLVRQFRHAAGEALLEIPAGTRDPRPDGSIEPPEETAVRELAEETGHTARSWRKLGAFWTAPGFTSELMHLYLARDLEPIAGYAGPDADERLEVERVSWRTAIEMAESGAIRDAKTLVGLFWLDRLAGEEIA